MFITYDQIHISGIEYLTLFDLEIDRKLNQHAKAVITMEMSEEQARLAEDSIHDMGYVTISADNAGTLFIGIKRDIKIKAYADYYVGVLELASTSYLLDQEKKSKTWQRTGTSFQTAMNDLVGGKAVIHFNITDKPLGSFWMQDYETNWEMLLKFTSGLASCIFPNVTTKIPHINIGAPNGLTSSCQLDYYGKTSEQVEIGTSLGESSSPLFVIGTKTRMEKGVLITTGIIGRMEEFKMKRIVNPQTVGKMYTGEVQRVDRNYVYVFFDSLNESYDDADDTPFEYAAFYPGSGLQYESGVFFMPEEHDRVRVFFPDGDGGEGFAFASELRYTKTSPDKRCFKAPGGQEILLTPDCIKIIGKKWSAYIEMNYGDGEGDSSKKAGLRILCDNEVNISVDKAEGVTDSLVKIKAGHNLFVSADNQIKFQTPEAQIEIDKNQIVVNAEQVYMI